MPEDILEPANEASEETFGDIDNAQEEAPAKAATDSSSEVLTEDDVRAKLKDHKKQ